MVFCLSEVSPACAGQKTFGAKDIAELFRPSVRYIKRTHQRGLDNDVDSIPFALIDINALWEGGTITQ
jgi:hypothetical protein